MPLFALTLFVSATLLFLVQPMIAKMILPRLGGTAAVWNTCMVFFQAALLAGYGYAHVSTSWLGVRRQAVLHVGLLAAAVVLLPISVPDAWIPPADANPIPWLLGLLVVSVGLPFFVVSSSAPLLQKWYAGTGTLAARDPYFLYAASNLGSMLALVSYPLLVEPFFRLAEQGWLWTAGYIMLALLTAGCAIAVWRLPRLNMPPPRNDDTTLQADSFPILPSPPLTLRRRLSWLALAFVPSSLMLGVTTYLTTDIAPIPLLWVIPLALYLLSFVLAFARLPGILYELLGLVLLLVTPIVLFLMVAGPTQWIWVSMLLHLPTFFVAALVCHGELARQRPSSEHLTEFYLWLSIGGVLGGLANALIAPVVFNNVTEYPLALVLACMLVPASSVATPRRWQRWAELSAWGNLSLLGLVFLGIGVYRGGLASLTRFVPSGREFWSESFLMLKPGWVVPAAAAVLLALIGYVLHERWNRVRRLADVLMAAATVVPAVGLIWGAPAAGIPLDWLDRILNLGAWLMPLLIYSLLALLCYTLATRPARFGMSVGVILLVTAWCDELRSQVLLRERSFFGVLRVTSDGFYHRLSHGTTLHGMQSLDATRSEEPLTYYHRSGPIGQAFDALREVGPLPQVALVGLGTGSLAGYGEPGQTFTFYEIDPTVERIARDPRYFTYLTNCRAELRVFLGDARLRLAEAPDGQYRFIIVDAFSSDAIPVHLLTREAMQLYLTKLTDDGVLAMHISNRYLSLEPVLFNLAESMPPPLVGLIQEDTGDDTGKYSSTWVVLARRREHLGKLTEDARWKPLSGQPGVGIWTDDFSNILSVYNWR